MRQAFGGWEDEVTIEGLEKTTTCCIDTIRKRTGSIAAVQEWEKR